ncbi:MAG: cytochrome ubiquinol oxidase subunit I [Betaproteobacteria bacterium]|nr:cytochrome ubiquinol oxidase subunit I [Betaproteobacteria bacterium]NBT75459.1 cytochrome ubiquinol oxidase subunit I [Betaproteobacteria bacterium]NCA16543.1 cytochrome ubiquinol oxidase subunit I [Betaproteobacteria bacterium]
MDALDTLLLSRIQFAANVTFHILFPAINIALAWLLVFFKVQARRTAEPRWMQAYEFWVKVFALTFAMGVVSGITMSFQFGTNWPGFMNTVGNVAGPLLAYEVLTAFFLEATMLGVMLFGRHRVSDRMHTFACFLVAAGTTLSAVWILALNSWMHTPTGFEMVNGQAHVTSWIDVIFNPSFPYRFVHMMLASGLTMAFLVSGLSAYRWRRGDHSPSVLISLRTGLVLAAVLIPLQIIAGDMHGLNTMKHQPAKIAAMEGIWETQRGANAVLFAVPNSTTRSNDLEVSIPKLASFYLTHDWEGEVRGLNEFENRHPPVQAVFWGFRIMVGVGMLMLAVSWLGAFRLLTASSNTDLPLSDTYLRVLVVMTFSGWVALVAGWYVTEVGRQPWLVHGVLTAADAATKIPVANLALSLPAYLTLYMALISAYISVVFYLARKHSSPLSDTRDSVEMGLRHV